MNPNPFQTADLFAKARQGLATLQTGQSYAKVRCVVRGLEVKRSARGEYLSLQLGDRTGDATAISWEGAGLATQLAAGTVVEFDRVEVDEYGPKFAPRDLHVVAPGAFEPREFVPALPQEVVEANWVRLQDQLDTMENPDLQVLREAVFATTEVAKLYKTHPSALSHHHNYLGGNVEHVLGLTRVVDAVCSGYPEIDRDVALFGAAIHDLGKLREYAVDTTIRVTDDGRLRGHLVIGAEWLAQICDRVRHEGHGVPRGLEAHLVHIILSHHRRGDWGSPKPPASPEAMLVHLADYADSQAKNFLQDVEKNRDNPDGWAWRKDGDVSQMIRTRRDWDWPDGP